MGLQRGDKVPVAAAAEGEVAVEAAAVPEEAPTDSKGKKKGKKAAGDEEDLDALFAEFGVTIDEKKKKNKKR